MTARVIPDVVTGVQLAASDPAVSAWVSANAGAGKTHVLAQRVIRLLLDGNDPGAILCITFTKAAAANMAKRVYDTLAAWTVLDDDRLDEEIRKASRRKPDAALRAAARRLFARALETPGGLKVQTIHAFCTRLLHQFPFEANVAARFSVMDDTQQQEMLQRLSLGVLIEAAARPESALGRALATAISQVADQTFMEVVGEAITLREKLAAWIAAAGGVEAAVAQLGAVLGVAPGDSLDAIDAEIVDGALVPLSEWTSVAAALTEGSKTDADQATRLREAFAKSGAERVALYKAIFLTREEEPRQRIVTKGIAEAHPELALRLYDERDRLVRLVARRRAVACRDKSAALIVVAEAVISRYRAEKDHRGLLDYNDLIAKTRALLANVDAAWVHYKLDLGIDHVLIDEAQDTSPAQWDIIKRITAEFFAGAGARASIRRTIFAVGDEKQSIFSFQGAAPHAFADSRDHFARLHRGGETEFRPVEFKHSFRSGPNVLGAVDVVFTAPAAFAGVTSDSVPPTHAALADAAPGVVEIWPLERPDERPDKEAWDAPFDAQPETSPAVKLANRLAREVRRLIDAKTPVGPISQPRRPATWGDVLILVGRRGALSEAIIRALKNAGVPVAGADRLVLAEHIAVMDLMVLADALLLPDDDLALATALKSPLFGLDDDDLFRLAYDRPGSLRASLAARAGEDARFAAANAKLATLATLAREKTPFDFFAHLLGPMRGRRQFAARLGAEAADALHEFLNLALDHERRETPTLQNFLAWLRAARAEVKRDMEIARDEVRVMTVHGAKGLEAPIVVLADTTAPPAGHVQHQAKVLPLARDSAGPNEPDCLAWIGRVADDVAVLAGARERARHDTESEYRRLLYVAMTRAAERLVIAGVEGERARPKGCWYDLVHDALVPYAEEIATADGPIWRYRKQPDTEAGEAGDAAAETRPAITVPDWLGADAPITSAGSTPLTPSSTYDETTGHRLALTGNDADRRRALARGRALHRLLQSLPDVPHERRAVAARDFLCRHESDVAADEHDRLVGEVTAVLDETRFAPLFVAGSRAEVAIVGRIERDGRAPILVSGQIDRLAVTADAVLIADFKTNRRPPRHLDEVPPAYVEQLALYRAVLARLYPGRPVRAALIWTEAPDLMEVSGEAMDRALARLTTP
jgi:ATP-dependent helicase/nuclease subunit A